MVSKMFILMMMMYPIVCKKAFVVHANRTTPKMHMRTLKVEEQTC